jgi:hypothetical protein
MARGRPIESTASDIPRKFKRVYEHEDCTIIWKFDLDITDKGPIEVDIRYKDGADSAKNWNKRAKEAKEERRINREMKKINEKNNIKTNKNAKSIKK